MFADRVWLSVVRTKIDVVHFDENPKFVIGVYLGRGLLVFIAFELSLSCYLFFAISIGLFETTIHKYIWKGGS